MLELATVKFNMEFVCYVDSCLANAAMEPFEFSWVNRQALQFFVGFFYIEYVHMVDTKLWDIKSWFSI